MGIQLTLIAILVAFASVALFSLLNGNRGKDPLMYSTLGSILGGFVMFALVRFDIATLGGTDNWDQVHDFWKFLATSIAFVLALVHTITSGIGATLGYLVVRKRLDATAQCWVIALSSALATGCVYRFFTLLISDIVNFN